MKMFPDLRLEDIVGVQPMNAPVNGSKFKFKLKSMNIVNGNLISLAHEDVFDVIIHGSNCQCIMNGGIARDIRISFPQAYKADQETTKGDSEKLGTFSSATISMPSKHVGVAILHPFELTVVNAYTQFDFGNDKNVVYVDYDAVRSVFKKIKESFSGKRIGYPMIGSGLANGDWDIISEIINEELEGELHTLVKLNG